MNGLTFVLMIYAAMSLVTFAAFALDKRAAVKGLRRTPEATLHTLELFGGWPGALLAMSFVRHKNRKSILHRGGGLRGAAARRRLVARAALTQTRNPVICLLSPVLCLLSPDF